MGRSTRVGPLRRRDGPVRSDRPHAPGSVTRPEAHMTITSAEHAAMRRALALAASPGVPTGPNPRVGCVLLDDDGSTVAEGWHRGAGSAARRGRRAAPGRGGRARHDRRRDPRAVQPHRPHRPVCRGRWSTPAYAAWSTPSATPTRSRPGAPPPCAPRGSRSRAACSRTRPARVNRVVDLRHGPRPPLRDLEVRDHPRRPQRRRRRHQPLGLLAGRPASTPTGCGRSATRCSSAPTPSRSTTPCSPSATPTTDRCRGSPCGR